MSAKINTHHILWQKRHWDRGWALRLRNHPYCKIDIPKDTLHRFIHESVIDIPVPTGPECKNAYIAITSWIDGGFASMDDDLSERCRKIAMCFRASSPSTYNALIKQKQIADEYKKG